MSVSLEILAGICFAFALLIMLGMDYTPENSFPQPTVGYLQENFSNLQHTSQDEKICCKSDHEGEVKKFRTPAKARLGL